MKESTRCREAFEKAGHDRMDFWFVWRRAWAARARSDAKKNRSVHAYLRLEREAHRQFVEEHRIYVDSLQAEIAKLHAALKLHVFNLDKLSEAENRYLKAEAELEALKSLAQKTVREALEYADVHPCDVNDDEVKARYLSENMRALYEAIK